MDANDGAGIRLRPRVWSLALLAAGSFLASILSPGCSGVPEAGDPGDALEEETETPALPEPPARKEAQETKDRKDPKDRDAVVRPAQPRRAPQTEPKAPKAAPRGAASPNVAAILKNLKDPAKAEATFWKIAEVPTAIIPGLIEEVESTEPSALERIQVLVLDPDFMGEGSLFLANRVHGLGKLEEVEKEGKDDYVLVSKDYTKMSIGLTRTKKKRLVIDKAGGFPIGVVVRAGLINRFRSTRYPASSDDDPGPGKLIAWWREFYSLAKDEL